MKRTGQLAAFFIALAFVLSAAGYGIVRGVTAKDYSAYNQCVADYLRMLQGRPGARRLSLVLTAARTGPTSLVVSRRSSLGENALRA